MLAFDPEAYHRNVERSFFQAVAFTEESGQFRRYLVAGVVCAALYDKGRISPQPIEVILAVLRVDQPEADITETQVPSIV